MFKNVCLNKNKPRNIRYLPAIRGGDVEIVGYDFKAIF